ncbi:MAG: ABC transporter ATP-binding protein [Bdellovibrionaceae bacterium]|nr:ABC transporter ATP-binding protein [Pseudobdellovibrionaceae bacterium]
MIEVKNFRKSFGKKLIHADVSFNVKKGECMGLIGGSGAGKSVILRSLIGLEKPDSGEILIDGENIAKLRENQLVSIRKKVAYVFQGGALFDSMTVFENLAYPLKEHTQLNESEMRSMIITQLGEFGLANSEHLFPGNLSGGMQKRVGLARALMMHPQVVLYDEPTAGLDPYNTKKIQEHILKLKAQGMTSILVTHDMPTAFAVCDRMCFLLHGKIEFQGKVEEIQEDKTGIVHKFINGEEH